MPRPRPLFGTLLLVALPAAPFLVGPWNALAVAVVGGLWLRYGALAPAPEERPEPAARSRRPPTGFLSAAVLLGVAVLVLLAPWAIERTVAVREEAALAAAMEERWVRLWADLEAEAERAAQAVGEPPGDDAARLRAFDRLSRRVAEETGPAPEARSARPTLLLADPDGEAVAWAGEGLLNEPAPAELVSEGLDVSASFGSVTLLAVEPLGPGRRPWRVVSGRSFRTDELPFDLPPQARVRLGTVGARWSVARPGTPLAPGVEAIAPQGLPVLVWQPPGEVEQAPWPWEETERRVAWGVLAVLIIGAAVVRGLRMALPSAVPAGDGGEAPRWSALAAVAGSGAAAASLAGGAPAAPAAVLVGGFALLAGALAGSGPGREGAGVSSVSSVAAGGGTRRRTGTAFAAGALGTLLLLGALVGLVEVLGRFELAARMWPGVAEAALRTGVAAATLAVLMAGRRPLARVTPAGRDEARSGGPNAVWGWGAFSLLLAAGAAHDLAWVGAPFLILAGGAAAVWAGGRSLRPPTTLALLLVFAAGIGAAAWETVHRTVLKDAMGSVYLDRMAPPDGGERARVEEALREHFAAVDLAEVAPRDPDGLEREDLAFTLWRRSPLARANSLSALLIEPLGGPPSMFAFGPVAPVPEGDSRIVRDAWVDVPWEELSLPAWDETQVAGEATLRYAGTPWAVARYWLLPRPGFSLERSGAFDALELGLLQGRAATDLEVLGLPEPAAYGLYDADGRAVISPWPESPPLQGLQGLQGLEDHPGALARGTAGGRLWVESPTGRSWAWSRAGPDGVEVLYLPVLGPLAALERVGAHAVGGLLTLAAAAALVLLLALPRPAFRNLLGRTLRSYSKRLMVVLTLLVLLPLLLFNLVVLSDAEERMLREQRASGEAALASAQQVIGDYVVSLDPGFGFTTLVDDELLMWVSRVVHHQVNLYWGSAIWASSKPELFAAGLLPERIPGDIYSRLALLRYDRATRTNRAGRRTHLEIYAPLRIPGGPADQERLLLSMPLLAQQEEVAEELGLLRRRAILVSSVLFGLLIAVGIVLARRFTEPIEELVEGTRRIAAGAPSLDLAPRELELAALVDAVDAMAGRIAESRERLVREKEVVERMVENITSGVVSLDREWRVLMHNRVARDLLGVEVGERVDEALRGGGAGGGPSGRLEPVADFLRGLSERERGPTRGEPDRREGADRPRRATVHLAGAEGGDEREWSLVWVPVPGTGEPTALLVVEDATEVLRSQRLQAWAEMARIIAHEIKNPLTPLRLSTEHLREVYRGDGREFEEVFERCTTNILKQVDELRVIASEFSTFSSIPRIDLKVGDLVRAMRELVEAYRSAASAGGVEVALETERDTLEARFDERLLGRAVRNLVENALRASGGEGRVEVRVTSDGDGAVIEVRDQGPGVPPDLLPRIFDPNFSTHDTGTGLGLPIARRIAEEHGGSIGARNRPGGGLGVTIRIPL